MKHWNALTILGLYRRMRNTPTIWAHCTDRDLVGNKATERFDYLQDLVAALSAAAHPNLVILSLAEHIAALTGVIAHIRQHSHSVVVAHLHSSTSDQRCQLLEAGAHHVLHGPTSLREILLQTDIQPSDGCIAHANWSLNANSGVVSDRATTETLFTLSTRELELLTLLAGQPNQVIKRQCLDAALFPHADGNETHRINMILTRLQNRFKRHDTALPIRSIFAQGVMYWTEKRRITD